MHVEIDGDFDISGLTIPPATWYEFHEGLDQFGDDSESLQEIPQLINDVDRIVVVTGENWRAITVIITVIKGEDELTTPQSLYQAE